MSPLRIALILLVTGGVLTLALGVFDSSSDPRGVRMGMTGLPMGDGDPVVVPPWAGLVAIGVGAAVLLGRKAP